MKKHISLSLLMLLLLSALALGQNITTAEFSGLVISSDNQPLPGVTIKAVHVPTGTVFTTLTRDDGRFNIPAVRVGGPYTINASLEGFREEEFKDVYVKLGENKLLNIKLNLANVDLGQVTVVATEQLLSTAQTGAAENVSESVIENMPSISRNFADFARLVPQVNIAENFSDQAYSVAGRNNRYNNVQIDGAVNNDLFGLADSGSPGGQAGTTPISLDAIQEFQIVLAPYDVRQGGFTGGGINAITRSGTNNFHGSAFFYYRNQDFVGNGPDETPYGQFNEKQMGFRIGGPIVKDKLFFFANAEFTRRSAPTDYVIDDSGSGEDFGGPNVTVADAERFTQLCQAYGFDPGSYGQVNTERNSNKAFGRIDYNINTGNRLTVRFNFIDAQNGLLSRSAYSFAFGNNGYEFDNRTYSTVGQLDSLFGEKVSNELRVNYTVIRDERAVPVIAPQVRVNIAGGYSFYGGTERYSGANGLNQDVLELTDNVTFFAGKHTVIIGTHNELFKFSNLFIRDIYGAWEFSNMDNFEAGIASRYEHSFSNVASQPYWEAEFPVHQLGFYGGDTWQILPYFNVTFGIRADIPLMPDNPTANPTVASTAYPIAGKHVQTDWTATGNILWSPRAGFNWDVLQNQKTLLRGGIGTFSGRTPYVWISNQYGNTGIEFTRYDVRSNVPPFVSDPYNQPEGFAAQSNEIDLINNDFKFPQVLRLDLAVDQELPWDMKFTWEQIYSKNLDDCLTQNINLKLTGYDAFDGRPLYKSRVSPGFSDVIYLTNSTKGYQYDMSFSLQKRFPGGRGYASAAYTYGVSKDQTSSTSSQARSNFQYNHASWDPNNPDLVYSNFDVRHRIAIGASYNVNPFKGWDTVVSMFYNGRAGRPYSTRYSNDVNGDGSQYNDCIFVPSSADQIILTQGTWADLNAYIEGDPALVAARNTIIQRNASREPWYHKMDLRILQDIPIPKLDGHKLQVSLDIMNFLNLLNKDWGKYQYVYYRGDSPLSYDGIDAGTGKPKMRFFKTGVARYETDQLASRWQMQLGVRYTF